MLTAYDPNSLRGLCGAIAASGFDTFHKIKSILQVAHEYLGTSSIIAYAHNRITNELEIIAMPGVAARELMRGPTDKLTFLWEDPTSNEGRYGAWLENDGEFKEYLQRLSVRSASAGPTPPQGDFRSRELEKCRRMFGMEGRLVTAKLYLWKGTDQTNDRVGQLFFNFYTDQPKCFTDEVRMMVRYVATLIRELLINVIYHTDVPAVAWAPEKLMRELGSAAENQGGSLEERIANIIRDAALGITENYGGQADFVVLIGERLGRVFRGGGSGRGPATILLHDGSITGTCVRENKYFIGNDINIDDYIRGQIPQTGDKPLPDFDPAVCRSVMIVPVMHNDEVRAVIRLTSPRGGRFLDPQARAMQSLERFARYAVLRVDEQRQRKQMAAALAFYARGTEQSQAQNVETLMQGVLGALGAEWGTFWPIDWTGPDGKFRISRGVMFDDRSRLAIQPEDVNFGIRKPASGPTGLTAALLGMNTASDRNDFFALHVLTDPENAGGLNSPYYLQIFSKQAPSGAVHDLRFLPDDKFYRYGVTSADDLPGGSRITLNSNTTQGTHTRIAFVVRDGDRPRAVVWLKFPNLHEVAWWERRYIEGLSHSLGNLLHIQALDTAIRGFRHMLPSLANDAHERLLSLREQPGSVDSPREWDELETCFLTLLWKTTEVRTLVEPPDQDLDDRGFLRGFERRSVGELVRRAIDMSTGFATNQSNWVQVVTINDAANVSAVFFTALINLTKNVMRHSGWRYMSEEQKQAQRAVIWVRAVPRPSFDLAEPRIDYVTCVGNTGIPLTDDPFKRLTVRSPGEGDHKIGLAVVKLLLERCGGTIRHIQCDAFQSEYPNAPAPLRSCHTFFEFTIPSI